MLHIHNVVCRRGGPQAATPLSAVFQFFLRDFAGMLGGILFAVAQVRLHYSYSAVAVGKGLRVG